ncbi:MAG TPA: hypothetical protein VGV35_03815, partial [Bryobacteraceae bacterium]|nr:hypothetical protein [Bryobacteraceae bacterium]
NIKDFSKVTTRDIYGKPVRVACWNHPEYRAWWNATVEDLFRTYPLDGFQWGAERMGPLMNVISPWNDAAPTCFCEHCVARGRASGIDPERARKGFEELYVYVRGLINGKPRPADGVFVGFLRVLIRYSEILSWEYQYRRSREEVQAGMYRTIKAIKPDADVGWHVDHQPSSWDLVYRAEMSYAEMARTPTSSSSSRITTSWDRASAIGIWSAFRRPSWGNFRWSNRWISTTAFSATTKRWSRA